MLIAEQSILLTRQYASVHKHIQSQQLGLALAKADGMFWETLPLWSKEIKIVDTIPAISTSLIRTNNFQFLA